MRKHLRYIAVAVAAATFGLAGCSGNSSTANQGTTDPNAPVTITFMAADPQKNFQPALDGFQDKYPNITVKFSYVPFDQFNNLVEQRIGGQDAGVDVYTVDSGAVGALADKGYLTDLSDLSDQVKGKELPATLGANSYNGKLWSLPMWNSSQYLFYNVDLLDKAGIEHPSQDPNQRITYEQLLVNAKKAQDAGAKWGFLFDQMDRYYQLQAPIESAGGGTGATGDDLLTASINNAGWNKAMSWYSQLFSEGVSPRGIATEQMGSLFSSGDAAYIVSGPWQVAMMKTNKSTVNYGVAANPTFEGGTATMPTGSWNLGINPASKQQDAARKLVEYLSLDAEGNELAASATGISPTNNEAFDKFAASLEVVPHRVV